MKEIHISVREGVAVQTDHTPYITGDGEYRVIFDLGEEWEDHPLRTARFQTEGNYVDVVFRGNQCRVPVFTYARTLEVGIFAGNLRTTTPARIFLREGIRSAWGSPEAPAPNVYDQLMEALEDNGLTMEQEPEGVRLTLRQRGGEKIAFLRYSEVYVGSGEMPDGYFVQVDPSGGTAVLRLRDRTGKITPIPSIRGEKGDKGDPGEPGPAGPKGEGERLARTAVLSTDWTGTGPYTQTLPLTGLVSTDTPHVGPVCDENKELALKQLESWNKVSFARAGEGKIFFTCLEEKPDTAVPIQIEVVR